MRVLLITGLVVGAQMEIWREIVRQGVDLRIVGSKRDVAGSGQWWLHEIPDWAEVEIVQPISILGRGQNWWYYPGLHQIIRRSTPTVIHVTGEPWSVRVSQALKSAGGSPVVAHSADNLYSHGNPAIRYLRKARLERTLPLLGGMVSWNTRGLDLAARYGLPHTTPTAVAPAELPDPRHFRVGDKQRRSERERLGITGGDVAIGFLGRLEEEKGPHILVSAFRMLESEKSHLFIFGDGSMRAHLQTSIRDLRSQVHLMGPLALESVGLAMAAMDVIVIPSVSTQGVEEQFSRVAVEAMMAGVAVVCTDCGALPEVVGDAALVVAQSSADQIASAIRSLLDEPERRRRLAELGYDRMNEIHHPAIVARRIRGLWDSVTLTG